MRLAARQNMIGGYRAQTKIDLFGIGACRKKSVGAQSQSWSTPVFAVEIVNHAAAAGIEAAFAVFCARETRIKINIPKNARGRRAMRRHRFLRATGVEIIMVKGNGGV